MLLIQWKEFFFEAPLNEMILPILKGSIAFTIFKFRYICMMIIAVWCTTWTLRKNWLKKNKKLLQVYQLLIKWVAFVTAVLQIFSKVICGTPAIKRYML
ncbi:hypothetical protein [Ferruginibacter sp.]